MEDGEDFQIIDHLRDFIKQSGRGICRNCEKPIQWSRFCVVNHKMRACPKTPKEEKDFFQQLWKDKYQGRNRDCLEDVAYPHSLTLDIFPISTCT